MNLFYKIPVAGVIRETSDSVRIVFDIPSSQKEIFSYSPGQYVTIRHTIDGNEIKRSYSICTTPYDNGLMAVAVKEIPGGLFSTYANRVLKKGDVLEVSKPLGNFGPNIEPDRFHHYVCIAAGSGITPLLSILHSVLLAEKSSKITLLYGNRNPDSVMFKTELENLVQQFGERLDVHYVFSKTGGSHALDTGRMDAAKTKAILTSLQAMEADAFYLCGPHDMVMNLKSMLLDNGIAAKNIHFELFYATSGEAIPAANPVFNGESRVTVIINGEEFRFSLHGRGISVLDAAIRNDVDVPFSCKGAVCCTCKAKILEGDAIMDMNYSLSDEEVKKGFILTCQAHPITPVLTVDFDV